mgnify:CR=1 FL=1
MHADAQVECAAPTHIPASPPASPSLSFGCLRAFAPAQHILIRAASVGDTEQLLVLLKAGARVTARDQFGLTALHHAAQAGHAAAAHRGQMGKITVAGGEEAADDLTVKLPQIHADARGWVLGDVPPADLAAQESQRFMRKMARIQTSRGLWDTARARGVLRRVLIFRPRGGEKVQPD